MRATGLIAQQILEAYVEPVLLHKVMPFSVI